MVDNFSGVPVSIIFLYPRIKPYQLLSRHIMTNQNHSLAGNLSTSPTNSGSVPGSSKVKTSGFMATGRAIATVLSLTSDADVLKRHS